MKIILTIPDELVTQVDAEAKEGDRTRSAVIRNCIRRNLGKCPACRKEKRRGDLFCLTCAAKNGTTDE